MAKDLEEYDLADPAGYECSAVAGWSVQRAFGGKYEQQNPMVNIGQISVPRRFELQVVPKDAAGDDIGWILMFLVSSDSKEITFASLFTVRLDADVAMDKLRAIRPIAWWKRKALLTLTMSKAVEFAPVIEGIYKATFGHTPEDSEALANQWIYNQVQAVSSVPLTRRRDRMTDGLLQETAEVYRKAWKEGANPTQAVAEHFHKTHSTAARYVGLARKSGHLGPANGSKGGELSEVR